MTDTTNEPLSNAMPPSVAGDPSGLSYQEFADTLPEVVWITDAAGRTVFLNRYWHEYTGTPRGGDLHAKSLDGMHPDDVEPARLAWDAAQSGDTFRHEYRLRGKGGEYRYFLARGAAHTEAAPGTARYWVGTATDVHALKQAQIEGAHTLLSLRRSEERYRGLVDASSQIVWTNDADGGMRGAQAGWQAFTGQSEAQAQGYGWADAVHPDDAAPTVAAWNEAVRTHSPFVFEHRVQRADGIYRHFRIRAVPVEENGVVREWVGIHTDITEEREAAHEQAKTLAQLSAILEAATDGIIVADAEGNVLMMNPAALHLHDFVSGDEARRNALDYADMFTLTYPDGAEVPFDERPLARAMRGERFTEYEVRVLRRDTGTAWWAAYSGGRTDDAAGMEPMIVLTVRDVSDRKQMEAQRDNLLRRIEEAADKQKKFLREMLSSMSEGRLRLCETPADLPKPITVAPAYDPVTLDRTTIRTLRRQTVSACADARMPIDRESDLITAVGEAAMNAVVHAGGGTGTVYVDAARGAVQIWVSDKGAGINEESLHRATLEKGFTTAGTLGHGFWMMLKTADRVYLLTGSSGTTVVIEQERTPPVPAWMQSFVDAQR